MFLESGNHHTTTWSTPRDFAPDKQTKKKMGRCGRSLAFAVLALVVVALLGVFAVAGEDTTFFDPEVRRRLVAKKTETGKLKNNGAAAGNVAESLHWPSLEQRNKGYL